MSNFRHNYPSLFIQTLRRTILPHHATVIAHIFQQIAQMLCQKSSKPDSAFWHETCY